MWHIFYLIRRNAPVHDAQPPRITELPTIPIPYLKNIEIPAGRNTNTRNPITNIFYTLPKNRCNYVLEHDFMRKGTVNAQTI